MVLIRSITLGLLIAVVTAAPNRNSDTSELDTLLQSEGLRQEDGFSLANIVDQLKKVTDQQKQAGFNPDFRDIIGNVIQLFKRVKPSISQSMEVNGNNQLTDSMDNSIDKFKDLIDEKRRIKTSLTLFKKYLEPLLDIKLTKVQCNELILRHKKIHDSHSKFEELQNKIQSFDENEEERINETEEIENLYFSSVAHAQELLQNCELNLSLAPDSPSASSSNLLSSSSSTSSKVPPIDNQVAFSAFAAGQSLLNTAFNFNFNLLNSQENGIVRDTLASLSEFIPPLD